MLPPVAKAARLGLATLAVVSIGCAARKPATPAVLAAAHAAPSYTADLRVSVRGASLRGRADAVVGFRRPDRLRIELPAGTGLRLVALARGDSLIVGFPGERAYYEGAASAETFGALLGVALTAPELMDVLVGRTPATVTRLDVSWGATAPERLRAWLRDGTRLDARVREPELGRALSDAAFELDTRGWRRLSLDEARGRWAR